MGTIDNIKVNMAISWLPIVKDVFPMEEKKSSYSQGPHQYGTFLLFYFQCQHPSVPPAMFKSSE